MVDKIITVPKSCLGQCVWQVQRSGVFVPAVSLAGAKSNRGFMPVRVGSQRSMHNALPRMNRPEPLTNAL